MQSFKMFKSRYLCTPKTLNSFHLRWSHAKRSHYEVLNLKRNCTKDDIRKSFVELSKKYHPDTSKTGTQEENARKFREIVEAYRVLSKSHSRSTYDAESNDRSSPGSRSRGPQNQEEYERWMAQMRSMSRQQYEKRAHGFYYYQPNRPGNDGNAKEFTDIFGRKWRQPINMNKKILIRISILWYIISVFVLYSAVKANMMRHMHDVPTYRYRPARYGMHGMGAPYNGQPIPSNQNTTSELDPDDSFLTKDYLDSITDDQLDDNIDIPK